MWPKVAVAPPLATAPGPSGRPGLGGPQTGRGHRLAGQPAIQPVGQTVHVGQHQVWPKVIWRGGSRLDRGANRRGDEAWLAVILPSPRRYERGRATAYTASRTATIRARMPAVAIR